MGKAISVKKLRKTFQVKVKRPGLVGPAFNLVAPRKRLVEAVSDVTFDVQKGEFLGFIGPNGAGKSTTIKILTGILHPTDGEISVLGLNPAKQRRKLAYRIGTVFGQKPQLWYHLPASDTYQLLGKIYELPERDFRKRLKFLVDSFEIGNLLDVPVRKLSLGQRMRCEIVASLLHRPEIIFLDEPTIGLDVIAKQNIRSVLRRLNEEEGVTIFLTSHDAGDIETLTKRTIVINHGRVVFDDTTRRLKRNYIRHKVIELVMEETNKPFTFKGAEVIKRTSGRLKLRVPTSKGVLDKLLSYSVENFQIEDINIYDPPMEEIITVIYQEQS